MRDALIILAVCLVAIGAGAWLFLTGGTPRGDSAAAVSFAVVDRGDHSGDISERVNYRIKSVEEFVELWNAIHGENGAPPAVDFTKNDVLAIFDGSHATGGYSIRVKAVTDVTGLTRQVSIVHEEPGSSCMTTQALTSPYELIVVSKSEAALTREDSTVINECE